MLESLAHGVKLELPISQMHIWGEFDPQEGRGKKMLLPMCLVS